MPDVQQSDYHDRVLIRAVIAADKEAAACIKDVVICLRLGQR